MVANATHALSRGLGVVGAWANQIAGRSWEAICLSQWSGEPGMLSSWHSWRKSQTFFSRDDYTHWAGFSWLLLSSCSTTMRVGIWQAFDSWME